MNRTTISTENVHILYDADAMPAPESEQFELEFWENRDAVINRPAGRGGAVHIRCPAGEAVLKRYYRGGLMAKINHSHYFHSGYKHCRAFREFRLLEWMHTVDLPVPEPLAVYCRQFALISARMALLTRFIPDTMTLADKIKTRNMSVQDWEAVGRTIRLFHSQGIYHADLNANNIMLNTEGAVFLLDFDKAEIKSLDARWQKNNIQRLKRSLEKLFPGMDFPAPGWQCLQATYHANLWPDS